MEAIKSYSISKKLQNQGYLIAGILFAFFVIGLLVMKIAIILFLVIAVLQLIIAAVSSNHKIIKIFPKHFEIKLGFATSTKHIKNENFISINTENKKLILLNYYSEKGEEKTVKIAKKALEQQDAHDFEKFLKSLGIQNDLTTINDTSTLQKV